jgi:hypothetical protein
MVAMREASRTGRLGKRSRTQPGRLGGWRRGLDKSAELLDGIGKEIPWDQDAAFTAKEE